ncbi:MAG: hypothetical protein M0024_08720 [Nitrospiraceae bacterium]|nr:hypothetical protein [Nitrospiraceae bacterium]
MEYLLTNPTAEVLRGNPWLVKIAYESLSFSHKYTSGVNAFLEADIANKVIENIIDVFIWVLFAGVEEHGCSALVRHTDKGRQEIHFIVVNALFFEERILQWTPYLHWRDVELFSLLGQYVNTRYGLADPNDPERMNSRQPNYNLVRSGDAGEKVLACIDDEVSAEIARGNIRCREGILHWLASHQYRVLHLGNHHITIETGHGARKLKGGYYVEGFRDIGEFAKKLAGRDRQPNGYQERIKSLESKIEELRRERAARHQKRYRAYLSEAEIYGIGDRGLGDVLDNPGVRNDSDSIPVNNEVQVRGIDHGNRNRKKTPGYSGETGSDASGCRDLTRRITETARANQFLAESAFASLADITKTVARTLTKQRRSHTGAPDHGSGPHIRQRSK